MILASDDKPVIDSNDKSDDPPHGRRLTSGTYHTAGSEKNDHPGYPTAFNSKDGGDARRSTKRDVPSEPSAYEGDDNPSHRDYDSFKPGPGPYQPKNMPQFDYEETKRSARGDNKSTQRDAYDGIPKDFNKNPTESDRDQSRR